MEVFAAEAIETARALDDRRSKGLPIGKLHGVVVAIKDVICYEGHRVTAASGILQNFESIFSATAVQRLVEEEAIIIGNCNCDEFAMGSTNENSVYGRTKNALDEDKVPGGSSGGSAVAVQAGLSMVSLGSDTGGSVRQPADFCGIVGMKPSYGTISRHGLIAYASSFDQIGIFANNVDDISLVLDVVKGDDEFDSTASESDYRSGKQQKSSLKFAGFKEALEHPMLDGEIRSGLNELADKLQSNGHSFQNLDFDLLEYIVPVYYILSTAEASSNLARFDGIRYGYQSKKDQHDVNNFYRANRSEGFGKEVKRRIMLGTFVLSEGYYDAYFTKAQQVRRLLVNKTEKIFDQYDVLVLPTVPTPAFDAGMGTDDPTAIYLADIYTVFANLTGLPGISVPLFQHSNGMPFGVQVLCKKHDETTLLDCATMLLENYSFK